MRKYLLILFLCTVNILYAGNITITGRIINERQEYLPYVSCVLSTISDTTFVKGCVSDSVGMFKISVPPNDYFLTLSYIGYKSQKIRCEKGDNILGTILMERDVNNLGEIVVKGERPILKMENDRLTYSVSEIIKQKMLTNAHDLLKELPLVLSMDGNSLELIGATSTIICISGKVSQLSVSQLYDYLKTLPADAVEKVEILYNAPPQFHTKGSVINVILKKHKNYTLNGQLQTNWRNQHYNSYDLGGNVFASIPKWNYLFMYKFRDNKSIGKTKSYSKHSLPETIYEITSAELSKSHSHSHSMYAGATYDIDSLNSIDIFYNLQLTPKVKSDSYSKNSLFRDAESKDDKENTLHNISLSYYSLKGISLGVGYTNYRSEGEQRMYYLEQIKDTYDNSFNYFRKQKIDKINTYADFSHSLEKKWSISYGVNYSYVKNKNYQENIDLANNGDNNYSKDTDINEHTLGAYISSQKRFLNGKLSLNASLAGEKYKISDYDRFSFLPRVGITYVPVNKHILQFNFMTTRGYPSYWQKQDYTTYTDEYTVRQGNPLLKPSRRTNLSLLYVLNNKYVFQVTYYKVKDFFLNQSYQSPDKLQLLFKPFNVDANTLLFNSVIPFNIGNQLNSNFTINVWNEQYQSDNWFDLSYKRDNWAWLVMLNNTFTISKKPKIVLNLMGFYRSSTIEGIRDLNENGVVNAGISYSFLNDNAILSFKCNDIFETLSPKVKVRFNDQYNDLTSNYYNRSFMLSFTYKFKGYKERRKREVDTSRFGI